MEYLMQAWPWYVSGPLISLVLFLLLIIGKRFGMSSNLRTLCSMCGAGRRVPFFNFNWKDQLWNLVVVLGVILGGYLAKNYLSNSTSVAINPETEAKLKNIGFADAGEAYLPARLFDNENLANPKTLLLLILGGLLVGFGTRYAGGCTSGHAISGLSNLQLPSLIAVVGFFIGGLLMIHLIFPILF